MSEEVEETPDMSALAEQYFGEGDPEPAEEVAEEEQVEEVEQEELPADDEPQSDPKPDTNDLMDKELQKVQQLRATLEREVDKLQKAPTEAQADRVEKAKSKLDKYLSETDVDPYAAPRDIAEEVLADRDRVERIMQEHEAMKRELADSAARREAEIAQLRFSVDYPELAGKYAEFSQKAYEQAVEDYGADEVNQMSPSVYGKILNRNFMRQVEEASEKPKEEEPPKSVVKKPKATRIIKKNSGNSGKPDEYDPEAEMAKIRQAWFKQ